MQKMFYRTLFKKITGVSFAVTYWDGKTELYSDGKVVRGKENTSFSFHLVFKEELPFQHLVSNPTMVFGEAYIQGKIDLEGDIQHLISLAIEHQSVLSQGSGSKVLHNFFNRQRHTPKKAQVEKVCHHYNLGNDFFRLWLDDTMTYSCAYFRSPEDTLEKAQCQKIHHTLRKLNLKPGESLLDIGSGWGWLTTEAAKKYRVKAVGITLSKEQEKATRKRIKAFGLQDQVQVKLIDYRDMVYQEQKFDKIVSIGMFEHVGKENIPVYMDAIEKMLKPGGVSVLHTITRPKELPINPWLEKYIFPWGYIPSLREIIWELPNFKLHLLDVESLRLHYALTTDRWRENFELKTGQIKEMYGSEFVRMWRLYLAGCSASFRYSGLNIHQLLFSKGLNNDFPLTREGVYKNI